MKHSKNYQRTETGKAEVLSMTTCPIYRLPCTFTGLDAEIDNCDPPATVVHVEHESMPMSDGCVERYRTADGYLVDINIDQSDFSDWFEEEIKEVE